MSASVPSEANKDHLSSKCSSRQSSAAADPLWTASPPYTGQQMDAEMHKNKISMDA